MQPLIDIYNQAPPMAVVCIAVFYFISLLIMNKVWGMWYKRNLKRNVGAFWDEQQDIIRRLREELRRYKRVEDKT